MTHTGPFTARNRAFNIVRRPCRSYHFGPECRMDELKDVPPSFSLFIQELGRASIMEESSVLRIADGQQDAARRAQRRPAPGGAPQPDRLRRPGRSSSRRLECCRKVAPLFYVCPRLRPRRGLHRRSGGDDDACSSGWTQMFD